MAKAIIFTEEQKTLFGATAAALASSDFVTYGTNMKAIIASGEKTNFDKYEKQEAKTVEAALRSQAIEELYAPSVVDGKLQVSLDVTNVGELVESGKSARMGYDADGTHRTLRYHEVTAPNGDIYMVNFAAYKKVKTA